MSVLSRQNPRSRSRCRCSPSASGSRRGALRAPRSVSTRCESERPSLRCHTFVQVRRTRPRRRLDPGPPMMSSTEGQQFAADLELPHLQRLVFGDGDGGRPSGVAATALTYSAWPWRVSSSRPVSSSHTFSVLWKARSGRTIPLRHSDPTEGDRVRALESLEALARSRVPIRGVIETVLRCRYDGAIPEGLGARAVLR
jgi:hypothetical protein